MDLRLVEKFQRGKIVLHETFFRSQAGKRIFRRLAGHRNRALGKCRQGFNREIG